VLPHLFVTLEGEVDGRPALGMTSEGLPPKWFTKNPDTSSEADIAEMLAVIQNAVRLALLHGRQPATYYQFIQALTSEQRLWASRHEYPALLWRLGVSLVERALLDALCRSLQTPLHEVLQTSAPGIVWQEVHPALPGNRPDFLPAAPSETVGARHTVGLADPLRATEIPPADRLEDGLPQALDECIRAYGLRYFKIKLSGSEEVDITRLTAIAHVLETECPEDIAITLDGNENFADIAAFRRCYERLHAEPALEGLLRNVLWVEQPLHRRTALADSVGPALHEWPEAPHLLIDESDGESADVSRALDLGYAGVSHKNCKGILKGLANAAQIHFRRVQSPERQWFLSGEDLVNIGPLPLLQDLAVQALLGASHVERNGHHYFLGLSMYPGDLGAKTAESHPDLYQKNEHGLVTLRIEAGQINLASVNAAPFGTLVQPDLTGLPTVKEWIMQGGLAALDA
jgi:L-alanine-DL-glutamate epimerase-like enolase superfamily enzyme